MWLHMKGHMLGMAGLAGPGPWGRGRLIPPPLAWGRTGRPRGKPGKGNEWPGSRRPGLSPSMVPSSFISVSLNCHWCVSLKFRSPRSLRDGAALCLLGSGLRLGLQTPRTVETVGAGRGRADGAWRGLTCKQQLTPDTGPLDSPGVLTADHKMSAMGRTDQSFGFSYSVLKISLCILHTGDRGSVTGELRYLASTRSLSGEYPKVAELQFCNKWCLVAWSSTLTMVLSRRAGWEQLKCAGQQNIRPCVAALLSVSVSPVSPGLAPCVGTALGPGPGPSCGRGPALTPHLGPGTPHTRHSPLCQN